MKRYTKEEIETLRGNPNVKYVRENRLVLTYEFRQKIYIAWEKSPNNDMIRKILTENGINVKCVGSQFIKHLALNFRRFGNPSNGGKSIPCSQATHSDAEKLLETGKFVRHGKGIRFAADFEKELHSRYPEQTIEEGLRGVGISPETVGYQRIYRLERKFQGIKPQHNRNTKERKEYTKDEIAEIELHPYVEKITARQLRFSRNLYREARLLIQNGTVLEDVLKIFEVPEEWLSSSKKWALIYKIRYTRETDSKADMTDWPPEKKEKYVRIQRNRIRALESCVSQEFEALKEKVPALDLLQKKHVCEWIRDDLLPLSKSPGSESSLRNILKRTGISRSVYYRLLKDDTIAAKVEARKNRKKEEMDTVRRVAEYGGYPKGSRAIYMQMPILEGKRMSRGKICTLMQEMHLQCRIRRPNANRRAARKRLAEHVKPNLLKRTFKMHRPGEVILTDVTYLKYHNEKKLAYASATIDAVTGRLYEMNVSEYNDADLVIQTILSLPHPDKEAEVRPLLHSDQGVLYLSDEYQELLAELGFVQSMSKRGNCWDNAPQESFFGHFKDDVEYRNLRTLDELRSELERYKAYFNEIRGQWTRGKMTPLQREAWINSLSPAEYEEWQKKETERYKQMKHRSRQKAIERNKTLGV